MGTLEHIIAEHPFCSSFAAEHCKLVAGCARNVRFEAGSYLARENDPADTFFLLRSGKVAIETSSPSGRPLVVGTLGAGDIVGASWLVPPYRWIFDARAAGPVRAIVLDATCMRAKCEADHDLGYAMMKQFVPTVVSRLQAARLQTLDMYGVA